MTKGGDDIYPWAGAPIEGALVCWFVTQKAIRCQEPTGHANQTQGDGSKIGGVLFSPENGLLLTLPPQPSSPVAIK